MHEEIKANFSHLSYLVDESCETKLKRKLIFCSKLPKTYFFKASGMEDLYKADQCEIRSFAEA